MNRISVIIPAYQHAATLKACLDSIFAQTRLPDEVIVVNDGSTDDTLAVLAPYAGRIVLIDQENRGGNPARNAGFAVSRGDYVIFCDADVIMNQDMLAKMESLLIAHPEASFAYCGFRFGWKRFRGFPYDPLRLKKLNYIHTTSLIRREHFPGFDPAIKRLQDWDVWLSMLEAGRLGIYIKEELFSVQDSCGRRGISQWRPSFMYKIPWRRLGWMPRSMQKYFEARAVIARKHHL
jgi:glycosyltransferase involved in cell wall biosynthesis